MNLIKNGYKFSHFCTNLIFKFSFFSFLKQLAHIVFHRALKELQIGSKPIVLKDIIAYALNNSSDVDYTKSLLSHWDKRKETIIASGNFTSTNCFLFAAQAIYHAFKYILKKLDIETQYENIILIDVLDIQNKIIDLAQQYKLNQFAQTILPAIQTILNQYNLPDQVFKYILQACSRYPMQPKPNEYKEEILKVINNPLGKNILKSLSNSNSFTNQNWQNQTKNNWQPSYRGRGRGRNRGRNKGRNYYNRRY